MHKHLLDFLAAELAKPEYDGKTAEQVIALWREQAQAAADAKTEANASAFDKSVGPSMARSLKRPDYCPTPRHMLIVSFIPRLKYDMIPEKRRKNMVPLSDEYVDTFGVNFTRPIIKTVIEGEGDAAVARTRKVGEHRIIRSGHEVGVPAMPNILRRADFDAAWQKARG